MSVRFTYDLEGVTLHCFGTYDEGEDATREHPGCPPSFDVEEARLAGTELPFDALYVRAGGGNPVPLADLLEIAGMEAAKVELEAQMNAREEAEFEAKMNARAEVELEAQMDARAEAYL